MIINFQIGQCRVTIDTLKTKLFYERQPKVTELCSCSFCTHYEFLVVNKPVRVFTILAKMGVDLTRYDKDDIEGIWHIGERDKFENSYLVHYKLFGSIGKTQNSSGHLNSKGRYIVDFFENEDDSFVKYSFMELDNEEIEVRIEIECDRK
jgi:hypothetical protein